MLNGSVLNMPGVGTRTRSLVQQLPGVEDPTIANLPELPDPSHWSFVDGRAETAWIEAKKWKLRRTQGDEESKQGPTADTAADPGDEDRKGLTAGTTADLPHDLHSLQCLFYLQFNGTFDVSYSVDGGATWVDGTGDASAVINTGTGTADFGGMASNTSTSGDVTSVEFYSTSNLVDGQFNDNAADVIYREGGLTAGQYDGEVNGMVLDDGVVGLVGSNSGDFVATGGFTLSPNASN